MEVDEAYRLSAVLAGHEEDVRALAVLGDAVVTGSRDRTVRLWKPAGADADPAASYACATTLLGHTHYVAAVATTADGALASGSNDKHAAERESNSQSPGPRSRAVARAPPNPTHGGSAAWTGLAAGDRVGRRRRPPQIRSRGAHRRGELRAREPVRSCPRAGTTGDARLGSRPVPAVRPARPK